MLILKLLFQWCSTLRSTLSPAWGWWKWSVALSSRWHSLNLEPSTPGMYGICRTQTCLVSVLLLFHDMNLVLCLCSTERGKGDYHRLGHGSDDHVRRPRQVQGLQGKKVIAIATGSLHCVCCTEDGKTIYFPQMFWSAQTKGQRPLQH